MDVVGFSAGGHLAAMVGTHFDAGKASPSDGIDRVSSRPGFLVLIYPVITCSDPFRGWRRHRLLCQRPLRGQDRPR